MTGKHANPRYHLVVRSAQTSPDVGDGSLVAQRQRCPRSSLFKREPNRRAHVTCSRRSFACAESPRLRSSNFRRKGETDKRPRYRVSCYSHLVLEQLSTYIPPGRRQHVLIENSTHVARCFRSRQKFRRKEGILLLRSLGTRLQTDGRAPTPHASYTARTW